MCQALLAFRARHFSLFWVLLAGGGGFESSSTYSRRTRCPSYQRLIDVRTGDWLSSGQIEIALLFFVRRTPCPSTLGPAGFEPERALGVARRWRRAARQFVPGTFRFSCQALFAFFRLSIPKTPFSLNLACHADPAFFLIHSLVIGARHFPLFPLSFQARSDRLATHSNRRHQVAAGRPNDLRRHGASAWRRSFRTKNLHFFQIFLREVSAFASVSRLSDWTISRCVRRGTTPGRPQIANSDS